MRSGARGYHQAFSIDVPLPHVAAHSHPWRVDYRQVHRVVTTVLDLAVFTEVGGVFVSGVMETAFGAYHISLGVPAFPAGESGEVIDRQ